MRQLVLRALGIAALLWASVPGGASAQASGQPSGRASSAGSARGAAISFVDARGVSVELPRKAARVVSLAPELTEILFAAGAGPAVVGVTTYCNYPAEALRLPKVGAFSAKTISLESILALKPDLVVGNLAAHGRLALDIERAGLRFAALPTRDFEAVYGSILLAGRVAGDEARAASLVSMMRARVEAVRASASKTPRDRRPVVFWETWDEPLMSAGPDTFVGQIIEAAGGVNCFADAGSDWPVVSLESLLARDPDWILSAASHGKALSAERLAARPGWSTLRAVRSGHVAFLDGDVVSRAGPRFVDALEAVAAILRQGGGR